MTEICKGENYKYTLVVDGKEHVLEFYDIARLLGFRGGPLEQALRKLCRGGETHKGQNQDFLEAIDCINIAMRNTEYMKRGEKRFVLSEATERKAVISELHVDVTDLESFIPYDATHFRVNYHDVACYYKLDGISVYEWLAGEDEPFWLKLNKDEEKKLDDYFKDGSMKMIAVNAQKEPEKTINPNKIPKGATNFVKNDNGNEFVFYKFTDSPIGIKVFEWCQFVEKWKELSVEEADKTIPGLVEGKYRPISEFIGDSND